MGRHRTKRKTHETVSGPRTRLAAPTEGRGASVEKSRISNNRRRSTLSRESARDLHSYTHTHTHTEGCRSRREKRARTRTGRGWPAVIQRRRWWWFVYGTLPVTKRTGKWKRNEFAHIPNVEKRFSGCRRETFSARTRQWPSGASVVYRNNNNNNPCLSPKVFMYWSKFSLVVSLYFLFKNASMFGYENAKTPTTTENTLRLLLLLLSFSRPRNTSSAGSGLLLYHLHQHRHHYYYHYYYYY